MIQLILQSKKNQKKTKHLKKYIPLYHKNKIFN